MAKDIPVYPEILIEENNGFFDFSTICYIQKGKNVYEIIFKDRYTSKHSKYGFIEKIHINIFYYQPTLQLEQKIVEGVKPTVLDENIILRIKSAYETPIFIDKPKTEIMSDTTFLQFPFVYGEDRDNLDLSVSPNTENNMINLNRDTFPRTLIEFDFTHLKENPKSLEIIENFINTETTKESLQKLNAIMVKCIRRTN